MFKTKKRQGTQPIGLRALLWYYAIQRAVRTRQHLMVRTYDNHGYEFDPVELYDMDADRYQTQNLVADQPETVARMDHLLNEWLYEQSQKPYAIPDPMQTVLGERQGKR